MSRAVEGAGGVGWGCAEVSTESSDHRDIPRRRFDIAHFWLNGTQLVAVVAAVWAMAMAYRDVTERITVMEDRSIQLQSAIGEINGHLSELERR